MKLNLTIYFSDRSPRHVGEISKSLALRLESPVHIPRKEHRSACKIYFGLTFIIAANGSKFL